MTTTESDATEICPQFNEFVLERRLFMVRAEFRQNVLRDCRGDQLRAERIFADVLSPRSFNDLQAMANHWHLAGLVMSRLQMVARQLSVDIEIVWSNFQAIFFGHGNWCYAEVVARRLLAKLAGHFTEIDYSLDEEREIITRLIQSKNSESLIIEPLCSEVAAMLRQALYYAAGFRRDSVLEPSALGIEVWTAFRHLLRKYRSLVYSTSPVGGI